MSELRFDAIKGVVSDLQVRQDEKDFVFSDRDRAAGGMAAAGLALEGLAGAATGAALSSSDTAEKVDFFACKVGDVPVFGRFGQVTFADGDAVEVVGVSKGTHFEAFAFTRPSDRTIWMSPHCGRGRSAYFRYCAKAIAAVSISAPFAFILLMKLILDDDVTLPLWFWTLQVLGSAVLFATILTWVASKFSKFTVLSEAIFIALDLENPADVDLHQRLSDVGQQLSNTERLNYHPHARWVYKY